MLIFGVLGYIVVKLKGSPILLILPLILGEMVEHNFILAREIALGNVSYYFSPVSILLIGLTGFSILLPLMRKRAMEKKAWRGGET